MRAPAAAFMVPRSRLRLSRAPSAEIAAAAMKAAEDAELEQADIIVVAVEAGLGEPVRVAVEAAAIRAATDALIVARGDG